jgi:two-component system sensor histidine kinase RpfC
MLFEFARRTKRPRYQIAICVLLDVGGAGCLAFFLDHWAIPLYFVALCLVIAYGYRYGTGIMLVALVAFATGFGASVWLESYWMARRPTGFLLLAGMSFTTLFVHANHLRFVRKRLRLQDEIDAHADFISLLGDELRMSLDKLMVNQRENSGKSGSPRAPRDFLEIASHFLQPLPDDILDYCAVRRGTFSATTQDFNLFDCVHRTLASFRRHASDEQRISLQVDPALPFALHGDERRLRRVMLHVMRDTLGGCSAGQFLVRLTVESGGDGQLTLRLGIFRARPASSSPANVNYAPMCDRASRPRSLDLPGRMAGQLVSALGGEIVRRRPAGWRLVELALPLSRQAEMVRQGTLDGMEALAIGFEEGSQMSLCTLLEQWSAITLTAPDLPLAMGVLSDAARTKRPLRLILLHADALRDGSDSGPDFARSVADATMALRRHCAPGVSIVLCVQGKVRSSVAGLLDAAPELLSVLESPIQTDELFYIANAAHAACAHGATGLPTTSSVDTPLLRAGNTMIPAPMFAAPRGAGVPGMTRPSPAAMPLAPGRAAAQAPYRILLAENNATNAIVLRKIVERGGHYCELVNDGGLALDRLTSDHFDAAVLDTNLPVMNGYELAKAYRYIAQLDERVPIILFSAEPEPGIGARWEPGAVAAFLRAPISAPGLLGALDRVIACALEEMSDDMLSPDPASDASPAHLGGEIRELDQDVLAELEEISPDPAFLDKLLNGFVHDNRVMLDRLHRAVQAERSEEARQLLHAIKGSAVSVGAIALKDLCCHLEKIAGQGLPKDSGPMMAHLEIGFQRFCNALDSWRTRRQLRAPR